MWRDVLNLARKIEDTTQVKLDETIKRIIHSLPLEPSEIKGDFLPVETVSISEVRSWIKVLNFLSKFDDVKIQLELSTIVLGHKFARVYRLPNLIEAQYAITQEGLNSGRNFSGIQSEKDLDIVWSSANSRDSTQPVGSLSPIFIQGQAFYDPFGNVGNFVEHPNFEGIDYPLAHNFSNSSSVAVIGESAFNSYPGYSLTSHGKVDIKSKHKHHGFRLAAD